MRATLLGLLGLALVLPGAVRADGANTLGARASLRGGWVDAGEFGSALGVGVDMTFGADRQPWMVGIEWTDGGLPESRLWPGGTEEEVRTNLWALTATWLSPRNNPEQRWQLGAGLGVYLADSWQLDEICVAPHVLVRLGADRGWFAEARCVALTDFGSDLDTDGLRASLGYQF